MSAPAARRTGPGRPRDPHVDSAVTATVIEMLGEVGYARLSITAVAQRAVVGKPAIYRRWRNKAEMVVDVLERAAGPVSLGPDTGTLRGDLEATYTQMANLARLDGGRLQLALLAELPFDEELATVYRARFVNPRREQLAAALRRAVDRGEARSDLDIELCCDVGIGVMQHRSTVTNAPLDAAMIAGLLSLMIDGLAVR
jgi:AcrR family transcriptional regulator